MKDQTKTQAPNPGLAPIATPPSPELPAFEPAVEAEPKAETEAEPNSKLKPKQLVKCMAEFL